jgi:hypothetical protein
MTKVLLAASLLANVVLSYYLFREPAPPAVVERLIIESHPAASKVPQDGARATRTAPVAPGSRKSEATPPAPGPVPPEEFEEAVEKMEAERREFLTEELGFTEEKLAAHNRLREEFFRESGKIWMKDPMFEPSFKERRMMLDMEEAFHRRLEELHGKKNFQRYQKFRESFNQSGYRKQIEDNQAFIYMGI